ncbi:MAG TPA: aminotransferase class I/II-fold pyridoxal phosphate-dependent enzyme [Acidimicrobiales bacterium]|nr:aminotransferase class I/II-fold pyridoxal phosphate-dependent enzyme [Acidimicrobiales bacterium]
MDGWAAWADGEATRIRAAGRWRTVRDLDGPGPVVGLPAGESGDPSADGGRTAVVSFASNDYLGLTRHPEVVAAARDAVDRWGTGAGSARLVAGARPLHRRLEVELAAWKGTEAAVLFPTGYAANVGVLQTVGGPGVTIISDGLNHASIVDGCRLSRAEVVVTPHGDVDAVERAILAAPGRVAVVTESVFSMDGDVAPLDELSALCAEAGALLVVDDAHGVLERPPAGHRDHWLWVGTLSKTLGALGGFVAGPAALCDLVVQRARSFVFTTASTPADSAAALAAVRVVCSPEGDALRARLRQHVDRLVPGHPSPIIPVMIGDEEAALAASAELLERGLLVPAIRPPTVAPGTSRLRISLTAAHTSEHVERLAAALRGLRGLRPGRPAAAAAATQARAPRRPDSRAPTGRPRRLVLVLGTGTGVGKTWVTASLAWGLRRHGSSTAVRKPVQSHQPGSHATDADVLAAATGEAVGDVCPPHRWLAAEMAPPMAAEALGLAPFTLGDLVAELRWPPGTDVGLVEGAGGPRSPLAADADNVHLACALRPDDVVLVADAGLGAINAVLLCAAALPRRPVVFLNRYRPDDPVHAGNADWLEKRSRLRLVTTIDGLVHALAPPSRRVSEW